MVYMIMEINAINVVGELKKFKTKFIFHIV